MKTYFTLLTTLIALQFSFAQQPSDILMTIDDKQVTKDEFLRIYNKNSSIADEQKKSVDDYLDLFINYKLKVIEAEKLGYDTVSSYLKEMDGYTKQLAKPYLESDESLDSFVLEAYQRTLEEVNASHILLTLNQNALPKDTAEVYNRIMSIRDRIVNKGESWDEVIKKESPNPGNEIGGDLGWFAGFRMVYPFESAAYNTPVGQISMPVRTEYGYHLVRVNDRRKNRGEVQVSHILTVLPKNYSDIEFNAAQQKIQNAYNDLQQGADWNETVQKYSEHKKTIGRGGDLGWLKTGRVPDGILDAAFALDSGEYSKPIQTEYGFHIIKVTGFRPVPTFDAVKADYQKQVKTTPAITNITKNWSLDKIKQEYGYKYYEENLDPLYAKLDSGIFKKTWNPDVAKDLTAPVFTIGDKTYTQYDLAKFISTKKFIPNTPSFAVSIRQRLFSYIDEKIYDYEISQLPKKYPEYRYLLEEYHDGILLFNLTEDKVWKQAVDDSTGLENYYNSLPEKYSWGKRLAITKYSYKDSLLASKILKLAKNRIKSGLSAADMSKSICPLDSLPCLSFVELKYEKGDNAIADSMTWKKGSYIVTKDKENHLIYFVDDILPEKTKTLKDARGLYTADYQTYLEKQWIQELRNKYTISINQDILNQIRAEEKK
jgi:peptidyl-prolyl cis-trans isomerase SurA